MGFHKSVAVLLLATSGAQGFGCAQICPSPLGAGRYAVSPEGEVAVSSSTAGPAGRRRSYQRDVTLLSLLAAGACVLKVREPAPRAACLVAAYIGYRGLSELLAPSANDVSKLDDVELVDCASPRDRKEGSYCFAALPGRIRFEQGSEALTAEAREVLDKLAAVFRTHPEATLMAIGHSDLSGSEASQCAASERRAVAVAEYVVSRGVARERVAPTYRCADEPLYRPEAEPWQAERNRRVEFRVEGVVDSGVASSGRLTGGA